VVRLIRSKGIGVYFCTQSPLDLPETVLGQLGNRVQHALRAYTPKDQKAVKTAAETFRANPKLNVVEAITELGVGEGLVSVLDDKGVPTPVERAWVLPPQSRLTPLTFEERQQVMQGSVMKGRYDQVIDRESAYEILQSRAGQAEAAARSEALAKQQAKQAAQTGKVLESMARSAARSIGTQIGRQLSRGVLGTLFGGGKKK
jgi:uncharacterized protein